MKTTDPKGGVTYSYYDELGRVVKVRDAEDYVTETSYTRFGEIASVTRRYNRTVSAVSTTTPPTVTVRAASSSGCRMRQGRLSIIIRTSSDAILVLTQSISDLMERYSHHVNTAFRTIWAV